MFSCGSKCNHVELQCYYVELMLLCVTKCYRGANVIMWNRFYHLKAYVIRGDEML
jgi:hypothetical protein